MSLHQYPSEHSLLLSERSGSLERRDSGISVRRTCSRKLVRPCELLKPLSRRKYPALTEEEEQISVPLQCLCLAIFDAVLVHMVLTLSPDGHWHSIKRAIVDSTMSHTYPNHLKILRGPLADVDVICLQATTKPFREIVHNVLRSKYHIVGDQSSGDASIIMLSKDKFPDGCKEVLTNDVLDELEAGVPVSPDSQELIVCSAEDSDGRPFILGSFQGASNGSTTKAIVKAFSDAAEGLADHTMVFGLDANTSLKNCTGILGVIDFLKHCGELGLRTCFPDGSDISECCTTRKARTYIQPQLNKAVRSDAKSTRGEANPRDHVLFQRAKFDVIKCYRDNTGKREYIEDQFCPTMHFPSDHGVVSVVLAPSVPTVPFPKGGG